MPLSTFINLPPQRQHEICLIAAKEFAAQGYHGASLNRIIQKAGIAKGSFYRYFQSKKEVFLYIIDYLIKERMMSIDSLFLKDEIDFFDLLKENFRIKLQFEREQPELAAFLYRLLHESRHPELGNMSLEIKRKLLSVVEEIIERYRKCGQLRDDIPKDITAFMIIQIQFGIYEYFILQSQDSDSVSLAMQEKNVLATVDHVLEIVKNGIKKHPKERKVK